MWEKEYCFSSICLLCFSLVYFTPSPTLRPWKSAVHPPHSGRRQNAPSSRVTTECESPDLLSFFSPVFLMTSSLWWSQAIFLLKDDYFSDPVMLFTTKVSLEAFSSYTLMSSDACFLSVLLFASYSPLSLFSVCDDLLLIPEWTCEHGFFLLPLHLVWHVYVNAFPSGRGVRSGCWMLCTFQFRRCICVSPLPCFMSLCLSSITQAELKFNSLELHNAYSIKKCFRFPDEYEALICMVRKLEGLRRPRFWISNSLLLCRDLKSCWFTL